MLKLCLHEARISNYPLLRGPQLFPGSLGSMQAAGHRVRARIRKDTRGTSAPVATGPGASGCPWFDPKFVLVHSRPRGQTSASKHEWYHNLWCPLPLMELGSGSRILGLLPLGWNGHSSGPGAQFQWPIWWPFWWHRGAGRGLCELLAVKTISRKGPSLKVGCFSNTVGHCY